MFKLNKSSIMLIKIENFIIKIACIVYYSFINSYADVCTGSQSLEKIRE